MDIGVDPVVGVAPVVVAKMKKTKETAFRKKEGERLFDAEGCWYTFWGFLGVIPSLMS